LVSLGACGDGVDQESSGRIESIDVFEVLDVTASDSLGSRDTFGSIDGAVLLDSRVVVLDRMSSMLRLFDRQGVQIDSFGSRGQGPGEFSYPVGLQLLDDGELLLIDRANLRVSRLTIAGDSLALRVEHALDFVPTAFCAMGNDLFIVGAREGALVHRTDWSGTVRQSFLPIDVGPVQAQLQAQLRITCGGRAQQVVLASSAPGTVRVLSVDGDEVAFDSIPGFSSSLFVGEGNAVRRVEPPGGVVHTVAAIQWLGGAVFVQLRRRMPDRDPAFEPRLFDPGSGEWIQGDGLSLPQIVVLSGDTLALTKRDLPFPQLAFYRLRDRR
jgi:hypothetical protein